MLYNDKTLVYTMKCVVKIRTLQMFINVLKVTCSPESISINPNLYRKNNTSSKTKINLRILTQKKTSEAKISL